MYFPYLYARRFELLALRDVALHCQPTKTIVPILEPITEKPNDLVRCLKELDEKGIRTSVILNPCQGDFKKNISKTWRKEIDQAISKSKHAMPAFTCDSQTSMAAIELFLSTYSKKKIVLLYSNSKLTNIEIKKLALNDNIVFHIVVQDRITTPQRAELPKKKTVDIRDQFNSLEKNAYYVGSENFSDKHLSFAKNGIGFGDFSVIGALYRKGGGEPAAVVIHAIFKDIKTGHLHVEHFLSDDIEQGVGSVGEKFLQAAGKLVVQAKKRKDEFGANSALEAYFADVKSSHYPGLGENKRRQIHHHLSIVHNFLTTT